VDGIYQTIDGGESWQPERRGIPAGTNINAIAVDPRNGAHVLAGTADGQFYRSTDGGTTWQNIFGAIAGPVYAILFDPIHPGAAFATGNNSPLYTSSDGGADWQESDQYFGNGSGILCLAASERSPLPTDPVNPPYGNPPGIHYFSSTGHNVRGPFLDFYNRYTGLKVFGLPLTEAFWEDGHLVQYFERAELIYANGRIHEAPLGRTLTQYRYFYRVGLFPSSRSRYYFSGTGHSLSGSFLTFWRNHAGSLLFGAPISEPLYERNGDGTGRTYLVQYFENARMEYHPELAGTSNVVTLGLLGREVLQQGGWL
jgi:hypothetical protein